MLRTQEPQTYKGTSQLEKSILDFSESIQTPPQAAKLMQPRDRALHEPAEHAQAAAGLRIPGGQDRGNPQPAQQLSHRLGVVTPVPLQALRLLPLGSGLA